MRATLAALLLLAAGGARAQDCEQLIKTHGFLGRAQVQCNYRRYAGDIPVQARDCIRRVGEDRAREPLAAGASLFDAAETERGHVKMCAQMLRDFPTALTR